MARRSPLLLLLLLPALALIALYGLDEEPHAPESVASAAISAPAPEAPAVALAAVAEPEALPVPAAETAPDRRVRVAARIEGRITYANGAMPGGKVLVYASMPGAIWRWERAGRRIHVGLNADTLVQGFADEDGHFVLEWTGDRKELAVAAMAPTAATEATVRWRVADKSPLNLTLEPRAALFVDVRAGAGFDAGTAPDFRDSELRLRLPSASDERASGIPAARRDMSGWVDDNGRATFLAVAIDRDFEVAYRGPAAVATAKPVPALSSAEQRAMVLELPAGAHLVGRVVDESGAPVVDASVVVHDGETHGAKPGPLASARSDTEGRFEMQRLALGAKVVEISKEGFSATNHSLGADLVDGVRRDLGDLPLEFGTRFGGQVREPDGRPAAGAKVTATLSREIEGPEPRPLHLGHHVRTADAEGRFAFRGLPKGFHFDLVAERRVGGSQAKGYRDAVRDGDMDLVVVLGLSPALVGRVVTPSGEPKPFAEVRGTPARKPWEDFVSATVTHTDKDGNFRLELDKPGSVFLEARAKGFAPSPLLAAKVPSNIPVELQLRPALSVVGTVVDTMGQPVRGAVVALAEESDLNGEYEGPAGVNDPYARSGADGRFEIANQGAGELVLAARHADHARSEDVVVQLGEGMGTPEIVLTLRRGATVRGVLYRKGERAGAGIQVVGEASSGLDDRDKSTNAAGEFAFNHLTPGRWTFYSLHVLHSTDAETQREHVQIFDDPPRESLQLEDGAEYQLDLGARPENPVVVRGVVRTAGRKIKEAVVCFVSLHETSPPEQHASVDHAGHYEVVLPRPGSYWVGAHAIAEGGMGNVVELRCEIPIAASHQLDIHLPGGAIRGQVRGPDGRPVRNALVVGSREDGIAIGSLLRGEASVVHTDDQGRYELPLLSAGSYRVLAGGNDRGEMPEDSEPTLMGLRTGVVLESDEVRDGVDVELAHPGDVRGRVVDRSGNPVPSATIFARDKSGVALATTSNIQSDPTGSFDWKGLPPGEYTFEAKGGKLASAESARVTVRAGGMAQVELVVDEGAYLIVSVEGAEPAELAQGLSRLDVHDAHNRQAMGLTHPENFEELLGDSSTKEHRVGPLAPGSYRASVTTPSGKRAEGTVELKAGDERRLTLRLKD